MEKKAEYSLLKKAGIGNPGKPPQSLISGKPLKYRNHKVEVDGITFDSKKEAARYSELKILEQVGEIKNLSLQPKFQIVPKVHRYRARFYVADFQYEKEGQIFVEDVKSEITRKNPVFTLKRQLFLHLYGEKYFFLET